MKKLLVLVLGVFFVWGFTSVAAANLLLNPGFEGNNLWSSPADFDYRNEYGNYGGSSYARSGSYSAFLRDNGPALASDGRYSSFFQGGIDLERGLYEFGAWFALKSDLDPSITTNYYKPGVTLKYPPQTFQKRQLPCQNETCSCLIASSPILGIT